MAKAYEVFTRALEQRGLKRDRRWLCPAHDDSNPSLSVFEGADGRVLVKCHAGCSAETIVAALGFTMADLFDIRSRCLDASVTTYDYRDEHGELRYQVCREKPKRFWQRRPDRKGGWIANLKGVQRVPYRLPELLANPKATVYVVEGEKDADRLGACGLVATTNAMGAGQWRREYNRFLRDRDVVVIPDNDEPGREHATEVAWSLRGTARSVKIVELTGLLDKGDVSDWLDNGHTADELVKVAAAAPSYTPNSDKPALKVIDLGKARSKRREQSNTQITAAANGEKAEGSGKRESLADQLIATVLAEDVTLFHDERGEPYAALAVKGGRRILSLSSRDFGRWLGRLCWNNLGRAVNSEGLASTKQTLGGIARFDHGEHRLHVRVANHERAIWIDMDGQRAIRVLPRRWEIVTQPPILFRSFPHQRSMPDPIPNGDPWELLRFVNIRDPEDQLMLLCFLVVAMVPGIPIAPLVIHGVQGSAKTTLLKVVKRLIDPAGVEVRGGVRDLNEFALAAFQNRVLFYDNLTSLPDWLSDALCRVVSGEGWSKRTLYQDEDSTVFEYQSVVGLAGINLVAERPDFLDRSIILRLEPVTPTRRRNEQAFWNEFEAARPRILGGLLDALSRAMCVEPGLWPKILPRMADFARWGAAAAVGLRKGPVDFLGIYDRNVGRQHEAVLQENPVAQAALAFMEERPSWQGQPAELLELFEGIADQQHLDKKSTAWPKSASWLTRRLNEVQPTLLALGVEALGPDRTTGRRLIELRKVSENAVNAAKAS